MISRANQQMILAKWRKCTALLLHCLASGYLWLQPKPLPLPVKILVLMEPVPEMVRLAPLPEKELLTVKDWLPLSIATFPLKRASGTVPVVNCDAFKPLRLLPLPEKALAVTVPDKVGLDGSDQTVHVWLRTVVRWLTLLNKIFPFTALKPDFMVES